MAVSIMIVDDHPLIREGLVRILERQPSYSVVAEAGNGQAALDLIDRFKPDILLLDLMMPGLNGFEVIRRTVEISPRTRIIVISMHSSNQHVLQALRAGAVGYLVKDSVTSEILQAIREVLYEKHYLSASLHEQLIQLLAAGKLPETKDPLGGLSDRERDVFFLVVEGLTNQEMAERLSLSVRTVERYRMNMMDKLKLRNQRELIRYAIKNKIINIED